MNERWAILEKDDAQADLELHPGKADTTGWMSKQYRQELRRGRGDGMYTRKTRATREALGRG